VHLGDRRTRVDERLAVAEVAAYGSLRQRREVARIDPFE